MHGYTNRLNKVDSSKINIEQQICLMKTDDNVKEKAMVKLREVKSKSDDGGSKARQYLDGLLKIPFGVYRKEPIMDISLKIKEYFEYACFKNDVLLNIIKDTNIQKFVSHIVSNKLIYTGIALLAITSLIVLIF